MQLFRQEQDAQVEVPGPEGGGRIRQRVSDAEEDQEVNAQTMMHKYHNSENLEWTPPTLSSEQWENAYNDLKRKFDLLLEHNIELTLKLEKASEWRKDHDVGC